MRLETLFGVSTLFAIGCGGHANGGGTDAAVDAAVDGSPPQCVAGASVCGNGNGGTVDNTSYTCNGQTIGTGTACAFGCDDMTGECSDLVPANQAATNLAAGDAFTCTGTQNAALSDIIAGAGDKLVFNTGAGTIAKNTTPITGALWGSAYTPTNGTTTVIVAHVKSLQISAGASVSIAGANALVLLVDTDATIAGPAIVDLSGHYGPTAPPFPTFAGPGASFAMKSGAGGASSAANQSGGGGAGHAVAGGDGGDGGGGATPVAGGLAFGSTFVLAAGGYGGGASYDNAGKGGGGLQVSACGDVSISTGVIVNASGGGGKAGGGNGAATGAWGGGSGGTIILEGATTNSLAGALVANGGGGGQGGIVPAGVTSPQDGSDWDTTGAYNAPALGGGVAAAARSGGAGGAGATAPVSAVNAPAGSAGGGGGGSYGAIFIANSPVVGKASATASSPAPYYAHTCTTIDGMAPATCPYVALP